MGNQASSELPAEKKKRRGNPKENSMMKVQMSKEASIIVKDDVCLRSLAKLFNADPSDFKEGKELLSRINEFLLKQKLNDQYYDGVLMGVVRCLLTVGLIGDEMRNASTFTKTVLTDLRNLGELRPEGIALLSGFKTAKDLFVIKTPRSALDDVLIHEYFVASGGSYINEDNESVIIRGTNFLRKYCLNYAQILGAFRCTGPVVDPGSGKIYSWCELNSENEDFVNYIVYEKIPGKDLRKSTASMDKRDFVSVMLQICYALEIGYVVNGFTHYDLHDENVILRPVSDNLGGPVYVPFFMGDKVVYIKSNYIATIIDYGRCHIQSRPPQTDDNSELGIEHFGYHASYAESTGIYADRARPFYDIFKLLGFTLDDIYSYNPSLFDEVWCTMRFFGFTTKQQVIDYITGDGRNSYFSLGKQNNGSFCLGDPKLIKDSCMREQETKIGDFVSFFRSQFAETAQEVLVNVVPPGSTTLQCGSECLGDPKKTLRSLIYDETVNNVNRFILRRHDRDTGKGVFEYVVYYKNLEDRYLSFIFNDNPSRYHLELKEVLDAMEKGFDQTDLDLLQAYMVKKIEKALASFETIKKGILYDINPSLPRAETGDKLTDINNYLDRTTKFAKEYAEAVEVFEYFKILFKKVSPEKGEILKAANNLLLDKLAYPMRRYREIMDDLSEHLESMVIHPKLNYYYQKTLLRTF